VSGGCRGWGGVDVVAGVGVWGAAGGRARVDVGAPCPGGGRGPSAPARLLAALYRSLPSRPATSTYSITPRFAYDEKIVLLADEVYQENIYQDERPFISARKVGGGGVDEVWCAVVSASRGPERRPSGGPAGSALACARGPAPPPIPTPD
jgi:hypothetical protein